VYWWDAVHDCESQGDELTPPLLVTVGFLDKKTKKYIRIYGEYEEGDKAKDFKRHQSAIPSKMVHKIVYLGEKDERKETEKA